MPYFKNNYILLLILCSLLVPASAHSVTIENALKSSLVNNLEIKLEKNNILVAKESVNQSISSYFPSIILQGAISESEVTNIKSQSGVLSSDYNLEPSSSSITISQNIFNGFANYYSLIKSKTDLKSQNLIYENKKQEIILATLESYYNVILAEKNFASFKDNFTAIKKRYNSAQAEFEAGILSKTDVAFAKTRMSAAKIALINSDINYEKAKNIFRDITGVEAKDLKFQSIKSKEIFEKEQFIENVKSGSFAIRLATLDVNSKNASTGIARSSLLPKISLNASQTEYYDYSSTVDQFDNETINATVTWQIFNSGSSLSKIRQAEKIKNSSYINQLMVIRDTLNRANFSHSQYLISSETVDAAKIALESAEFAYNGTVIEQEVGERTLLDVLDARQQLLNSEINLFKEQRNEQIIEARLLYLKGDLVVDKLFNN
ncbi:TolC family protein [Pelagibacteraceae bacterium]|nr:TolC family protein [Pelagibacteraceae bacterium]